MTSERRSGNLRWRRKVPWSRRDFAVVVQESGAHRAVNVEPNKKSRHAVRACKQRMFFPVIRFALELLGLRVANHAGFSGSTNPVVWIK